MSGTVTVEADHSPPRVRIDTTSQTVTRLAAGTTETVLVRGIPVAGVIYDYECPQQTPVTYDDGAGLTELVELPNVGDWLIHIANPDLSCQVVFNRLPGEDTPSNSSIADIPGGPTIAVTFPRSSDRGAFTLNTYSHDEKLALKTLLGDGSTLFLSTHDEVDFGPCYVALGEASWARRVLGIADQGRRVSLPYVEVDRPAWVESMSGGAIEDLVGTIGSLVGTIGDLGA